MCFAEKRSRPKAGRVSSGDNNIPVHHEDLAGKDRDGHALADDAGLGGRDADADACGKEGLAAAEAVGFRPPALDEGPGGEGGRVNLLAVDRLMR